MSIRAQLVCVLHGSAQSLEAGVCSNDIPLCLSRMGHVMHRHMSGLCPGDCVGEAAVVCSKTKELETIRGAWSWSWFSSHISLLSAGTVGGSLCVLRTYDS